MCEKRKEKYIKEVAFQLFLEKGYEATTIRSICKKTGIEAPTLYNIFGSKKGLLFSILQKLLIEECKNMQKEIKTIDYDIPLNTIYTLYFINIKYSMDNLYKIKFLLRFYLFPPEELKKDIHALFNEFKKNKTTLINLYFQDCLDKGLIELDINQAVDIYLRFLEKNRYDIVFLNWRPNEEKIEEFWNMFIDCRLRSKG